MLGPSCRGTGLWFISDTLTARAFSPHSSDSPNYSPGNSSVQEPALRPCLLHTEVRGGGERREKLAGDRLNPLAAGRAPLGRHPGHGGTALARPSGSPRGGNGVPVSPRAWGLLLWGETEPGSCWDGATGGWRWHRELLGCATCATRATRATCVSRVPALWSHSTVRPEQGHGLALLWQGWGTPKTGLGPGTRGRGWARPLFLHCRSKRRERRPQGAVLNGGGQRGAADGSKHPTAPKHDPETFPHPGPL